MRKIRSIVMAALLMMAAVLWAQEPPEALNVHRHDGSVNSTLFDGLQNLEFLDGSIVVHLCSGASQSILMDDVRKITFGDYVSDGFLVLFSVVDEKGGTLSATADGVEISSGTSVKEGSNVLFTAIPDENCEVKEWKINGVAVMDNMTNTLSVYGVKESLNVTVEFNLLNALAESMSQENMKVYRNGENDIVVESTLDIKACSLMDICGRIVYQGVTGSMSNQVVIPVNYLPAGVYLVNIETAKGNMSRKVIISK